MARHLADAGIGRDDIVAVHAERNAGLAWAMLGVLKAGAAFMLLDPAHPAARSAQCLLQARPRARLRLDTGGGLPPALEAALRELPIVASADWRAVRGSPQAAWRECSAQPPDRAVAAVDLAYVAFTSGSTGEPKAIAGTHSPLTHFFEWHGRQWSLQPGDRFSVLSGLGHDPLLRDVLGALWLGASCWMPESGRMGDPGYPATWMSGAGITVSHLTPAMAELIAARETDSPPTVLPALRHVFCGGEALRAVTVDTLRRLAPAAQWVNYYGATETPQAMGWHAVAPSLAADALPVPIGRGIDDVQLLVLNESGQLAGIGELGEIHVRTPYLARGYLHDAAETGRRFVPAPQPCDARDRMYRTGDLGRYRPDGEVDHAGRRDGQ
ncbi:AMP-binding protein [Piscinibacter aquaticus]|uniref:AMP-binding protein n=1 Tax=Piscinibacter aquaticus TaxID=392597 RepID=A0A5C6U0L3_9BURK|nr:AMP-binding protein [Piscinibacter aquaticus]